MTPKQQQQMSVILRSLSTLREGYTLNGQLVYCLDSPLAECGIHICDNLII